MTARIDVLSICNALMDLLIEVSEVEFDQLAIEKGIMHLVTTERQQELMKKFKEHAVVMELGGSAMNTTRALAQLGLKTSFFGTIGRDFYGEKIESRMKSLGIRSFLEQVDEHTGTCLILVTPDGERTMNTHLGASACYHKGLINEDHIKQTRLLHFTGYQWSTENQKEAIYEAIQLAQKNKVLISFDVADPFMVRLCGDEFRHVITRYADLVFANAEEASELFATTAEKAADEIIKLNPKATAVIKLGAKGALIAQGEQRVPIDAVTTHVVDTTAAGDMFAAGFLYGYLNNLGLKKSGQAAALLASDVISRMGAHLSDEVFNKVLALSHE